MRDAEPKTNQHIVDLDLHCQLQREMDAAVRDADSDTALELYLNERSVSIRKAGLEWALVSLLRRDDVQIPQLAPGRWPTDRADRPSGAALRFMAAQLTASDPLSSLPPGLGAMPALPGRYKEILARVWLDRPSCEALADSVVRHRFAGWLAQHPPAIGSCLLAAAASETAGSLVSQLATQWLTRGLLHSGGPDQIARASAVASLADVSRSALRRCLGFFFEDAAALVRLIGPALRLGDRGVVLILSETLMTRKLNEKTRRYVLAVRLAALADALRREQVASEYRRRWQPSGWDYPWPERLLYVFQQLGERDLSRHLLTHMEVSERTPRWVLLTRDMLGSGEPGRVQLEAWQSIYQDNPSDERILVGLTSVILRCPRPVQKTWTERLGLRQRWQQLAAFDAYRDLANAFLVLLLTEEEDRIAEFEARLASAPLELLPVRMANRAYVAALRRTKQWQRIRKLEKRDGSMLHQVCTFEERDLVRVMARQAVLPDSRQEERRWCEDWERLISLPLLTSEVIEVLDHFVNLRQTLERQSRLRHEPALYADVSLQVLRRCKAEAEALLARSNARATELGDLRGRLRRAGPEATLRLLQDLAVSVF